VIVSNVEGIQIRDVFAGLALQSGPVSPVCRFVPFLDAPCFRPPAPLSGWYSGYISEGEAKPTAVYGFRTPAGRSAISLRAPRGPSNSNGVGSDGGFRPFADRCVVGGLVRDASMNHSRSGCPTYRQVKDWIDARHKLVRKSQFQPRATASA